MSKSHGIKDLEKSKNLVLNKTNINDILYFRTSSTKSHVDEKTWIYIERKIENSSLIKLGKKLVKNNLLVLKLDDKGVLYNMKFYDLTKMNDVEISKLETTGIFKRTFFIIFLQV